ncbi:MAG: ClbS/DfsB family four-helix bundle protein [Chloroflexota bacterium]
MTEQIIHNQAELLAALDQGWNDFQAYLGSLSYEQVTIPTDAAGWTVKDHLTHLYVWENGMLALLEKQPRAEAMGLTPELLNSDDYDAINEVIRQQYQNIDLRELQRLFFGAHERLVEKIRSLSDEDLQRPYHFYQPGSESSRPVINPLAGNTFQHYAEHMPWIDAIAQKQGVSVANLLDSIQQGWDALNTTLGTLSETQLTRFTDARGWTVKDHAIHLAIWEDGMYALLERLMRVEYMGIDEATWEMGDNDQINAIIQQRYKDLTWADVQQKRQQIHQRLIEKIASLSDEDLLRPYRYYEMASTEDHPVVGWLVGNTFGHYAEHLPWIKAIADIGAHKVQAE